MIRTKRNKVNIQFGVRKAQWRTEEGENMRKKEAKTQR